MLQSINKRRLKCYDFLISSDLLFLLINHIIFINKVVHLFDPFDLGFKWYVATKYHGNDCHQYLKTKTYVNISERIYKAAEKSTSSKHILSKAKKLSERTKKIWGLFSDVDSSVSHSKFIPDDQIMVLHICL